MGKISSFFGIKEVQHSKVPKAANLLESIRHNDKDFFDRFHGGQKMDYMTSSAYSAIFTKVATNRQVIFREIDRASESYLIDVILDIVCDYALSPDISTDEILDVSSDNKTIQKEVELLDDRFNFDSIAMSVCRDLIKYGSYYLRTEVRNARNEENKVYLVENLDPMEKRKLRQADNKQPLINSPKPIPKGEYGLVDLHDDVDQRNIVALSSFTSTLGFLSRDIDQRVKYHERSDFLEFTLSGKKTRIDMASDWFDNIRQFQKLSNHIEESEGFKIPRYIRAGKSVLYPILGKVKELELLEKLVPASKLSKLSNGTILSVMVPERMDIAEAMDAMDHIEQIINKQKGVSKTGELTAESIMNASSMIKCVPNFGGVTGSTEVMQTRSDEPDDLLSSANDIRNLILSSVGVPSELVFMSETTDKKEILKRYARFLRLLRGIQKSITHAFKQMVLIHLANKFPNESFAADEIVVEFKNKLVEIDALDNLEFSDTMISTANNIKNVVYEMADVDSPLREALNVKVLAEKMAEMFEIVGYTGIINPDWLTDERLKPQRDE